MALSACAQEPAQPESLTWGEDAYADFAIMPRLTGEGAEPLNALFTRMDGVAEEERSTCLIPDNENTNYERTVWAPFTGPRFLSITVQTGYYCGGPHSNFDTRPMTFDRQMGGLPDWASLWPDSGITAGMEGYGYLPARTRAPALISWFRSAVHADPSSDPAWLAQCEAYYGDDPIDETIVVWLDAESGGVGMDWYSLPYVSKNCGSPQIMPVDEAARLGASDDLIAALRQGHADQNWHSGASE